MVSLETFNQPVGERPDAADLAIVPLTQAGSIIETLSSPTGRSIMSELASEPSNPAALAESIDTSVQNVSYHLDKLVDADLVTVVDTRYSVRGHEMDVFAPTNTAIVIEVDDELATDRIATAPSTRSSASSSRSD